MVSILVIAESIIAVCIALSFIHFKYFKSAVFDRILLELNVITKNLGGDSVVKAAKFAGLVGGASAVAPIVIVIFCQAYVHIETIIISAIGIYATLLAIFAQICKVILVAKTCRELFKRINLQLKVNGINTVSNTYGKLFILLFSPQPHRQQKIPFNFSSTCDVFTQKSLQSWN